MAIQVILMSAVMAATAAVAAPPPAAAARYQFEYSVLERSAQLEFGQQERRDATQTTGSYRVLLPDGRRQRVRYSVLGPDGYLADVTYEGDAVPYQPAPLYRGRYGPAARPRTYTLQRGRYGPAGRPRTYTLQSATEASLAAVTGTTPAVEKVEYIEVVTETDQVAAAEELADTEQADATAGRYDAEEHSTEAEQATEATSRGYGTKIKSEDEAERPTEPQQDKTGPVYQPRYRPQYQPRYQPRYYPQYYPRHYPRYRPVGPARTYYIQQQVEPVVSLPTTPATPLLETVGDEEERPAVTTAAEEAEQVYSVRTTDAGPVLATEEPGSEEKEERYESGSAVEAVTEAVHGSEIREPERYETAETTEAPQPTVVYGARITVAELTEEQQPAELTQAAVTLGPIYRRDTL